MINTIQIIYFIYYNITYFHGKNMSIFAINWKSHKLQGYGHKV